MGIEERQEQQLLRMTTQPVTRLVSKLALPCIISMLVSTFYNMADTYFVSQISTSASGAASVCFTIMAVIQACGFCMGIGCGNRVSVCLGHKDSKEANHLMATAFVLSIVLGLVLMGVGFAFMSGILDLLGATKTIKPFAADYAMYILFAAPFMVGSYMLSCSLRNQGNSTRSMIGMATGGVLNCILDPIFIFALDMGVAGAAIATAASQVVSFVILLLMVNGKKSLAPIKLKYFSLQWSRIRGIITTGCPSFFRQILAAIAVACLNNSARAYGDGAIAAMGIVARVQFFENAALLGYFQGFQIVCGFNLGADRGDRVHKAFWSTVRIGFIGIVVIAAAIVALAPQIVTLFRPDELVVEIGSAALRIQACIMPLNVWMMAMNFYYQVTQRPLQTNAFIFPRQCFFYIPLILLLPKFIGLTGIEISQALSDVATLLVTIPLSVMAIRELRRNKDKTLARLKEEMSD